MVKKINRDDRKGQKSRGIKVGKLELNKVTVKDLTSSERRKIKGGVRPGDGTGGNFSRDAGCE